MQRQAGALDALLVTTEKDMVKVAPFQDRLWRNLPQPEALPVVLVVEEAAELKQMIQDALTKSRADGHRSGRWSLVSSRDTTPSWRLVPASPSRKYHN